MREHDGREDIGLVVGFPGAGNIGQLITGHAAGRDPASVIDQDIDRAVHVRRGPAGPPRGG
jgi:hypothetical protein